MKETVPSHPSSSRSNSPHDSDVEHYQVDNISAITCEGVKDELEAYVVASDSNVPTIESVAIVNSNDVHIGNKTVYHGPVTIKQIVYPNSTTSSHSVEKCEGDGTVKVSSFPATEGVDNPTFVKDSELSNKDNASKDIVKNDNVQQLTGNEKGLIWFRNPKKHKTYIVILFLILVVIIVICITLVQWKETIPTSVDSRIKGDDTDEQEKNIPVDYSSDSNATISPTLRMYRRLQWLAQPPTHEANKLKTPVPLVIIQHTATENCTAFSKCVFHVRYIQQFHIESNQWWDIGYNFLVGGDGAAYEGRGWIYEGAHTLGYNTRSIGVGFIGTFSSYVPPANQIAAFKQLVAKGVELGYIQKDYKILAARQLYATESPGAAFFKEIKTWPHWSEKP